MRHGNHNHTLGVKKEHRFAMMSALATAFFRHGSIRITLAKAKALRPFAERIISLAKHAHAETEPAKKLHYYRLALAQVRDKEAVKKLFDETVKEFLGRNGGYTRIYKLIPRAGDAADMGLIEMVRADDKGYDKSRRPSKAKKQKKQATAPAAEPSAEPVAAAPAQA